MAKLVHFFSLLDFLFTISNIPCIKNKNIFHLPKRLFPDRSRVWKSFGDFHGS
ncbi:hypothetical protein LEP1GSC125_0950 [Leptospira mayottensis 200901122]|uniref:Uncharacterized protein n=1 Tax=Leptospira mayottensis 200901122 TaxID=1193010 RepID=A0AA87MU12_9LEPT|nr:hypothetical protein LEP1GSC125_0950 [Leptospira mayottensis 200901122]